MSTINTVTRRDGAAFLHNAAGFVAEHRRHARRWDLAASDAPSMSFAGRVRARGGATG